MLGRNSTNLAVYIYKDQTRAGIVLAKVGGGGTGWLAGEGSQCMVCSRVCVCVCERGGGGGYSPITLGPLMAKRRGRYRGRTSLGKEQTQ